MQLCPGIGGGGKALGGKDPSLQELFYLLKNLGELFQHRA